MAELKPISAFPPIAKLFIGLFTTLVLAVCLWSAWSFAVERSCCDDDEFAYPLTAGDEIDAISGDSSAALAPIWDTNHAGEPEPLDSGVIDTMEDLADLVQGYDGVGNDNEYEEESRSQLRHNLGLAYAHVLGQTLLFFALGAVFLFTSVKSWLKKLVFWVFAVVIVISTIALTGRDFHWIFDDILGVSSVVLMALTVYMCVMIYVELGRRAV